MPPSNHLTRTGMQKPPLVAMRRSQAHGELDHRRETVTVHQADDDLLEACRLAIAVSHFSANARSGRHPSHEPHIQSRCTSCSPDDRNTTTSKSSRSRKPPVTAKSRRSAPRSVRWISVDTG